MKIGILTSGGRITEWQADALREIANGNRFVIYDCANSRSAKRPFAHAGYYLLNLLAVRGPETRLVEIPGELAAEPPVRFESQPDGTWERLPKSLLDRIAADKPQLLVKLGMGVLRVPAKTDLACPILSYHHGDPRIFRGRPAGFYELISGVRSIGQVVQILSNELDAGAVVAFAETKVHPHSWRQSLAEAFRASPRLLPVAINNALSGATLPIGRNGRNYRLPSNLIASRFAAKVGAAKIKRLAYGAMVEKRWQVAHAELPAGWAPEDLPRLLEHGEWAALPIPKGYGFLADPFFDPRGRGVLAEAMRGDGKGDILAIDDDETRPLPIAGGHCSFPCAFEWDGRSYLLPEVSSWSPPRLYELTGEGIQDRGELDLPGRPRLLDATLHCQSGKCYLFANRRDDGAGVLRLWIADSPHSSFAEHPASPIRISPAGARMGGGILDHQGAIYRPGQDLRGGYGDGLLLFRIDELSPTFYREAEAASLRFAAHRGPHTLNIRGNHALFDYYDDRFTLLAGWRRLRQSRSG